MSVFLEVIKGQQKGQRFPLTPGNVIGTPSNENDDVIKILGRNIAAEHAKVMVDDKDNLVLICTNITNSLMVNMQSVKRVVLIPGVVFFIGDVQFRVSEFDSFPNEETLVSKKISNFNNSDDDENKPVETEVERTIATANSDLTFDSLPKIYNEGDSEGLKLEKLLIAALNEGISLLPQKNYEPKVRLLSKALRLVFIQGLQYDQEFFISWGPRKFGKATAELHLFDAQAPDEAFIIYPAKTGETLFVTDHPDIVSLNGKKTNKQILNHRDKIKIGDTIIQVLEV